MTTRQTDKPKKFGLQSGQSFAKLAEQTKRTIGEFYLTLKLDGYRGALVKKDGLITLYSRNGNVMEGFSELMPHFKALLSQLPGDYVIDGELLIHDYPAEWSSNERFRATQTIINTHDEKENLEYHVFDLLPLKDFISGKSQLPYKDRRKQLEQLNKTSHVNIVPVLYKGDDQTVIPEIMKDITAKALEGLMLNKADGHYKTKKTKEILKIKDFLSGDGIVTGVYEGKKGTLNENRLGGIIVTYKDTTIKVGGGFRDELRDLYWQNPELIVGKIAEYNYFEETVNKKGELDIRFSSFVTIRTDKGPDDVNYE